MVMPEVYFWTIEDEFQRPKRELQVCMSQVSYGGTDDGVGKHGDWMKTKISEGKIKHAFVKAALDPMKTPIANPIQFFQAMVNLMKFPEHRNAVQ